jgi:CspA family cold shock protein
LVCPTLGRRWKGYGFITRDSGAEDLVVHISAVERSGLTGLSEGDRVIVDIAEGRKRVRSGEDPLGLAQSHLLRKGAHGIRYSEAISTLPVFASQADLHSSNELSKAG